MPTPSPRLGHLHYGGSLASNGKLSSKPAPKNMFKKLKRLENMVRLEVAGFGEAAAAAMLCISVPRLRYIKKSPEYLQARIKITHGIILDNEAELGVIKEQRKEMLSQLLPVAFQALANEISAPATTLPERKHKTAIVQDLLDREGTFAKVSRTEVKPVEMFEFEQADEASRSIINAIRGIAPAKSEHTKEAVEANNAFSNSHTLSAVDQQAALDNLERLAAEDPALLELMETDGTVN